MSNIYETYEKLRGTRIEQLKEAISKVVNAVSKMANELPEDELIPLFNRYPKNSMELGWTIDQGNWIEFSFGFDTIGERYIFSTFDSVIKPLNMIVQSEYGLVLANNGYNHHSIVGSLNIANRTIDLYFHVDEKTTVCEVRRFKEDIIEAFPKCKIDNDLIPEMRDEDRAFYRIEDNFPLGTKFYGGRMYVKINF